MEIAIVHRSAPELRCAYCHDGITGADPCSGCGAVYHPDCAAALGGCSTLGCGRVAPVLRRPPARRRRDDFDRAVAVCLELGAWGLIALGCLTASGAAFGLWRAAAPLTEAGVIVGGVVVGLGLGTLAYAAHLGGSWTLRRFGWSAVATGWVLLASLFLFNPAPVLAAGAFLLASGAVTVRLDRWRRRAGDQARAALEEAIRVRSAPGD